ncbi:hypothetical protein [Cedecea sp.]|jgi:hypothetical protein|uniref:hypothetical protein n=1 Tax=Cedecea sp. TaxID=1970739 RepID=UPI002F41762B
MAMQQYVLDCPGRNLMTVTVTDYVITTLHWDNEFIVAPRAINIVDKNHEALSVYLFVNQDVLTINCSQNLYRFAYRSQRVVTCHKVRDISVRVWNKT